MVAASALCVSIGSYLFQPNAFIFFGILHMIAAAWVMGILALRLPVFGIAALALIIAIVPYIWRSDVFLHPALIWLGLHVTPVVALDYVPVFPWLSPFLFGMACAKWASGRVWWHRFSMMAPDRRWARPLAWPGRYSLLIYLLHQPVLISAFMAWVFLSG
jgi:uncharacterized membrane protein